MINFFNSYTSKYFFLPINILFKIIKEIKSNLQIFIKEYNIIQTETKTKIET